MKQQVTFFIQKLALPAARLFSVLFSSVFIYFILWLPYRDLMLVFSQSEYFWFDGRRVALASTAPLFIFLICYALITFFQTGKKTTRKSDQRIGFFAFVIFSLFILINAFSFVFYFYITFFTDYRSCKEPTLEHYFSTNHQVCNKILEQKTLKYHHT